jgi:hypothetical protein
MSAGPSTGLRKNPAALSTFAFFRSEEVANDTGKCALFAGDSQP